MKDRAEQISKSQAAGGRMHTNFERDDLEARKARLKSKACQMPVKRPGGRREYDDYVRARTETAVDIRSRLEDTFLDYERQAFARHEYQAATAYAMAAALVRGTCARVVESVVSQDERCNMQLPDGETDQGG